MSGQRDLLYSQEATEPRQLAAPLHSYASATHWLGLAPGSNNHDHSHSAVTAVCHEHCISHYEQSVIALMS
jgi:hypothetical protein